MVQKVIKAFTTAWKGLSLTIRHLFAGNGKREIVTVSDSNYFKQLEHGTNTIQYPKQQLPVPEVGRYQLDVEMDDCIVCDLCAKVCPVNCIDIESIKATEAIGQTSDGTTKRLYAAKFDIDMAKCMYCGLCTIVCPTECITMTNQYDKTVFQLSDLVYQFSDMTPEDAAEKRALFDKQQAEKQAAKLAAMKQKEGGA
ncbi:NADH-quinone oxidoreductase subunit I [Mucilaginibacter sp. SG538B]|jgi:NADH-quinone oxidoreductase subunit I|uniref:4Fe-4S binding protein n=1 Tax=Mucilaginibacter TaxID=423349 RepID=UPI0008712869|nr:MULTISPECIES: 4Fe-4S binding protein [unclassified Mucilaginibacter]NVM62043.1 NADH-quinone oxidoreductase subunit I [Mucilaginibacter sp. SG538B]SCW74952.1 NADH-quinone oxidoreductase subunit I [Mucilaginibacter sp. NFR10]